MCSVRRGGVSEKQEMLKKAVLTGGHGEGRSVRAPAGPPAK